MSNVVSPYTMLTIEGGEDSEGGDVFGPEAVLQVSRMGLPLHAPCPRWVALHFLSQGTEGGTGWRCVNAVLECFL